MSRPSVYMRTPFRPFYVAKLIDGPIYGFKKFRTSVRRADQHILSNTILCGSPIQDNRYTSIEKSDGKPVGTTQTLEIAIDRFQNDIGPGTFLFANASIDKHEHVVWNTDRA